MNHELEARRLARHRLVMVTTSIKEHQLEARRLARHQPGTYATIVVQHNHGMLTMTTPIYYRHRHRSACSAKRAKGLEAHMSIRTKERREEAKGPYVNRLKNSRKAICNEQYKGSKEDMSEHEWSLALVSRPTVPTVLGGVIRFASLLLL